MFSTEFEPPDIDFVRKSALRGIVNSSGNVKPLFTLSLYLYTPLRISVYAMFLKGT